MPNRIIKESILTSPTINRLSAQAERHFYRLLLLSDDHGCLEATPLVVRGRCYGLQPRITAKVVKGWQKELEEVGILRFWPDDERIFGVFCSFDKHNSKYSLTDDGKPTRHRRKTPEPPKQLLDNDLENYEPVFATLCQPLPNPKHKPNPNPTPENIYIEFEKWPGMKITQTNYDKLVKRFTKAKTDEMINKIWLYMGSHGKAYQSHYMTVLSWFEKEKNNNGKTNGGKPLSTKYDNIGKDYDDM